MLCHYVLLLLIFETDIFNNIIIVSAGKEHEILLESPDSLVSHIEGICSALIDPSQSTYERNTLHEFVCQFQNPEYYLSRCFACLYPYGRGCPSDKSCGMISNAKYTKHMLCLGGGPSARRFQQSAGFIFNMYSMEMRRKLGGVAFVAQKKNFDGTSEVEEVPNISDINKLLSYLEESISTAVESDGLTNVLSDASANALPFKHDEREMQKLIKRLIPYSNSLQGTATHISYERTKLMAMIPSPIINKLGLWRLFFTVAPADLYDSRFFEVVQSHINDSSPEYWDSRVIKVIILFFIVFLVFIFCNLCIFTYRPRC